jgi:hypothetical protein
MSSGDPGHILISGAMADMLTRFDGWASSLTALGEVEVKHGERVRIYNLLSDGAGNPEPPGQVRKSEAPRREEGSTRSDAARSSRQRLPHRKFRRTP